MLGFSKLKEFADNNFCFCKNGTKFSKIVEKKFGKGEIAHFEYSRHIKTKACLGKCLTTMPFNKAFHVLTCT